MSGLPKGWVIVELECAVCGVDTSKRMGRFVAETHRPDYSVCEPCRREASLERHEDARIEELRLSNEERTRINLDSAIRQDFERRLLEG